MEEDLSNGAFMQKWNSLQKRKVNEQSAVKKLDIEYPALQKAQQSKDINHTALLKKIGENLMLAGNTFSSILRIINPMSNRLLAPSEKVSEANYIAEADLTQIHQKYITIRELLDDINSDIADWVKAEKGMIINPNRYIRADLINPLINSIKGNTVFINSFIRDELWFYRPLGEKLTVDKLAQIAYRDYFNAVTNYFSKTDLEHEKTKNDNDPNRRIIKAPTIENLLKPEILKTLEGFELPTKYK